MALKASQAPEHVLIIGAGVFGLSTALALLKRDEYSNTRITIVDSAKTLPNPSGSSVDSNRIVRADYAEKAYSKLALEAQHFWRDKSDSGWGGQGRYHETGFVLTADSEHTTYIWKAFDNVKSLSADGLKGMDPEKIQWLSNPQEIRDVTQHEGVSGTCGYVNWNSGWADAEASVAFALEKLEAEEAGRISIKPGCHVKRLLLDSDGCAGVELEDGSKIRSDFTVLAGGAWSPMLINLQGRCLATGQTLAYLDVSEEEQMRLEDRPVVMNMSRGIFMIPPRNKELKVARHGFGYLNPVHVSQESADVVSGQDPARQVSVPRVGVQIPREAKEVCREALKEFVPSLADRPFSRTRICWYCDTPDGDFLIDYHPKYRNLFVATGGSGHGFKFFPVIGQKIVDAMRNALQPDLEQLWKWKHRDSEHFEGCEDKSRAGRRGMILDEEMAR